MKTGIIVLLLLFFAGMVEAKSKKNETLRAAFKLQTRWASGPMRSAPGIKMQNFQRYIKIGKDAFPAASATYTHIVEKKSSESIKEIAQGIKIGFGKKNKWKQEKIANGILMTGSWEKATRDIRILLLRPNPKEFVIFTTFVRKRYQRSMVGEVEMMEKRILSRHSKAAVSLIDYFIPTAQAQYIPTDPSQPDPYAGLANDIRELQDSLDQGIIELDETQELLQQLSDKWGIEMDQMQALFQAEADQFQELIATQSEAWLERADRGLDIMEKFTDPTSMALIGAVTAATGALATLAVNLVIDAIVWGIKSLVDLIFQISANKERWENFNQAREMWEEREEVALKLEQSLDAFLGAY